MKRLLLAMAMLCTFALSQSFGQITGVQYIMRYDTTLCRFDVSIKITGGQAEGFRATSQFNSSISIIVPKISRIRVLENFSPIQPEGEINRWVAKPPIIGPAVTPDLTYYLITPETSPTATLANNPTNILSTGDEIKLFAFSVTPMPTSCIDSVRFFRNNNIKGEPVEGGDPTSSAAGLQGGDFNNGFSIGGIDQLFEGVLEQSGPPKPNKSFLSTCSSGLEIDFSANVSACQRPLTYAWSGPNGYNATTQDVNLPNASSSASGDYVVVTRDAFGCKDTTTITAQAKPRAGADLSACSGTLPGQLAGSNPFSGTWSSTSPDVVVGPSTNGQANITSVSPTASGNIGLIYTVEACSDTLNLAVGNADAGPDVPPIACFANGVANLSAVGSGTWTLALGNPGTAAFDNSNGAVTTLSGFTVAGTYKIYWTSGGCQDSLSIVVGASCACPIAGNTINQPAETNLCGLPAGFTILGNEATPNTGIYQWQVSINGGGFTNATGSSTSKDYSPTNLTSGSYRYKRLYTLPNESNCTDESNEVNFILTIPPAAPSGLSAVPNPGCVGSSIIVSATGVTGASYTWAISSAQGGSTSSTTNSASFTPTAPGTYTVSVSQSLNGCASPNATTTFTAEATPNTPTGIVGTNPLACQGSDGSISINGLTPNASYQITYSKNNTPTTVTLRVGANGSLIIPNLTAGTYSNFIIATASGCITTVVQTLTLVDPNAPSAPSNLQAIPNPVCLGQTINLTTTGATGASFTWTTNNPNAGLGTSTTSSNTMNARVGGTFTISVVQTVGGCISPAATIDVTVNASPTPTVTAIPNPVCIGDPTTITVTGAAGATFAWASPSANVTLSSNTGESVTVTPTDAGSYTISVTQTLNGCASAAGTVVLNVRNCKNSKLGNFVWNDLNANGIQNAGEPGIKDVIVRLIREDDVVVNQTFTDENGMFQFLDVVPGRYYMRYSNTALKVTDANVGTNDAIDSDVTERFGPGTTDIFEVVAGEDNNNIDAGFYVCNRIGDLVWYDVNKNDVWDVVENGINGLTVNLFRTDGGTRLFATTTTGRKPGSPSDDGWFEFCAPPGSYYVQVVLPPNGLVTARPNIGTNRFADSDITGRNGAGTTNTFTIVAGQDKLDIGAGYYPQAIAGNLAWLDENVNGIQDEGEQKLANVKVEAFDVETNIKVSEALTNTEGVYKMEGLEQAEVYFKVSNPSGYVPTLHRADDKMNSDIDHSFGYNTTRAIKMVSGEENPNIDFGFSFSALPLKWESITATKVTNGQTLGHKIDWKTSSELNVNYFMVERSVNGANNFEIISSKIKANNNFHTQNSYNFVDANVAEIGEYVYRINQVDFDGTKTYSNQVSLSNVAQSASIAIFPNPTADELNISLSLEEETSVETKILNMVGQEISTFTKSKTYGEGSHTITIKLGNLPNGIYQVLVAYDGKKMVKEIVKQN